MAKSPFYLDDDEFYYEIVLSKGKGFLTKKAEGMLIKIANNFIKRKSDSYKGDDKNDCVQTGLLFMFQNWNNFNEKKYKTAMPYFSEIFKRGIAQGYNELRNKIGCANAIFMCKFIGGIELQQVPEEFSELLMWFKNINIENGIYFH